MAGLKTSLKMGVALPPLISLGGAPSQGGGVTPLGPTTATISASATPGTLIAAITGLATGEEISTVTPNDGRLALDVTRRNLIVGLSAISAGTIASTLTTNMGRVLAMDVVIEGSAEKRMRPAAHSNFDFPTVVSSSLAGDNNASRYKYVNQSGRPITELCVQVAGWMYSASQQFDAVDVLTKVGLEMPLGTKIATSVERLVVGGTTDILVITGINIPTSGTFWINYRGVRQSAGAMAFAHTTSAPEKLAYQGTDATDYTVPGSPQQPVVTGIQRGMMAMSVLSNEVGNPIDCVSLFGDSIFRGLNASWAKEACIAAGIVPLQWSVSGSRLDQSLPALSKRVAAAKMAGTTIALTNYGINDIRNGRTAAQLQANWLTHWANLKAQGFRVYQYTITPNSTQTVVGADWSTANQNPHPTFTPIINEVNDWLRDGAPIAGGVAVAAGTAGAIRVGSADHPLTGFWDYADVVSTARNSGIFKDGYTNDGLHPFTLAAAALIPANTNFIQSIAA